MLWANFEKSLSKKRQFLRQYFLRKS
jgi:hypothetical protein